MSNYKMPIRVEGDIAYVPLTKGYEAVIDADDVYLVNGLNWRALIDRNTVYAVCNFLAGKKWKLVRLHRLIMGEPNGLQVDHIDGNGLNNRKKGDDGNLRVVTSQQNTHNQRIFKNNTSGFKGVSWYRQGNKWRSYIKINGVKKHLGYYDTPEAAYVAYCDASLRFHGEFGRVA